MFPPTHRSGRWKEVGTSFPRAKWGRSVHANISISSEYKSFIILQHLSKYLGADMQNDEQFVGLDVVKRNCHQCSFVLFEEKLLIRSFPK